MGSVSITPAAETTYTESPIFKTYFAGNSAAQTGGRAAAHLYSAPRKLMECTLPYSETLSIGSTPHPRLQRHHLRRRRHLPWPMCLAKARPCSAHPCWNCNRRPPHHAHSIFSSTTLADAATLARQQHRPAAPWRGQPAGPTSALKFWRSGAGTSSYINGTLAAVREVSHLGLVDLNLSTVGTIRVQFWTDALGGSVGVLDKTVSPTLYIEDRERTPSAYGNLALWCRPVWHWRHYSGPGATSPSSRLRQYHRRPLARDVHRHGGQLSAMRPAVFGQGRGV